MKDKEKDMYTLDFRRDLRKNRFRQNQKRLIELINDSYE